jgi:hypothetical protein
MAGKSAGGAGAAKARRVPRQARAASVKRRPKQVLAVTGGEMPRVTRKPPSKWTKKGEAAFFETLAETCNVGLAAEAAGMRPQRAYERRKTDARFRRRWGDALAIGYARLELMLLDRALNGTEKVARDKCGNETRIREYSNQTAIALLKMHRDSAAEQDLEICEEDVTETRERITAKLRKLLERESARLDGAAEG